MGILDFFNFGVVMVFVVVDIIEVYFRDFNINVFYYDFIVIGDLGKLGYEFVNVLFKKYGIKMLYYIFIDCGFLIYKDE